MGTRSCPRKYVKPLIELRNSGKRPAEIGEIVGLTKRSVQVYLSYIAKDFNIKFNHLSGKWPDERLDDLCERAALLGYTKAGAEYGISAPRVSQLLKKRIHSWIDNDRLRG